MFMIFLWVVKPQFFLVLIRTTIVLTIVLYSTHYWCLLVYLVGSPTKVSPLFESSFFYELSLELDFIGKKYLAPFKSRI